VLKIQPFFARRIGQRLDTTVVLIPAAVEHDLLDVLSQRPFRDACADLLGGVNISAVLQPGIDRFFRRGSGDKRLARRIVDDLGINMARLLYTFSLGFVAVPYTFFRTLTCRLCLAFSLLCATFTLRLSVLRIYSKPK
jgi:hypothetical protein